MRKTGQIQIEHFTQALLFLLEETFDTVHGIYLDKGTSLFETLATISAKEASIPVGGRCATLAAQVKCRGRKSERRGRQPERSQLRHYCRRRRLSLGTRPTPRSWPGRGRFFFWSLLRPAAFWPRSGAHSCCYPVLRLRRRRLRQSTSHIPGPLRCQRSLRAGRKCCLVGK